jgi:hypothetical protein
MAHKHAFDLFARTTASASAALLALLACGSDADDGVEASAGASVDSSSVIEVRRRDDTSPTSTGGPSDVEGAADSAEVMAPAEPAGTSPAATAVGASDPASAPTLTFEACTSNGGVYGDNCDTIYVAVKQASPPRCVQFNIDNCGVYGRQGLGVDVPLSWRLASGSIGANANECEVGVFYTDSTNVVDASGTITWNEATRLPTELVMELTLVPSGSGEDATTVEIATSEPLNPAACAED